MADIYNIRDYQAKRLEQQEVAIMVSVMSGEPVPFGQEPTIYIDTAPCEYSAPDKDSA